MENLAEELQELQFTALLLPKEALKSGGLLHQWYYASLYLLVLVLQVKGVLLSSLSLLG